MPAPQNFPHTVRALGFLHENGYAEARALAQAFAGKNGRIATMEDIIDARLASPIGTTAWNTMFVTDSRIYYGLSIHNEPLIVITHGNGPRGDNFKHERGLNEWPYFKDGIKKIPYWAFLCLLGGECGPRTIIHLRGYKKEIPPNTRELSNEYTSERAAQDQLLRAIIGRRADEFLARHHEETRAWLTGHQSAADVGNAMTLRNMIFLSYTDWKKELSEDNRAAHVYPLTLSAAFFFTERDKPKHILGHTEIYTSSEADYMGPTPAVVGIRGKEPIATIAPPFEHLTKKIKREWRQFVLPTVPQAPITTAKNNLFFLLCHKKIMFTQRATPDLYPTGEPEFPVTKARKIAAPDEISLQLTAETMKSDEYPRKDVIKLAVQNLPPGANAILFHGTSSKGFELTQYVEYYCVEADTKPWYLVMPMDDKNRDWFTQYRDGCQETCEPQFPVTKKFVRSKEVSVGVKDCDLHYKKWLALAAIRRQMPRDANAAHILWSGCNPARVRYYSVKIDTSQAFNRLGEHRADFDRTASICQRIGLIPE